MTYEFEGTLKTVFKIEAGTGKIKEKCRILVKDKEREIEFLLFDENIYKFLEPLELEDKIKVSFSIKSLDWGKGYVTTCYAYHIEKVVKKERQQRQRTYNWSREEPKNNYADYFAGCKTKEEIKKKYRSLCKMFHPDTGGDIKVMQEINRQKDRLDKQYKK